MKRILISACLLGQPVRYNGGDLKSDHPILQEWLSQGLLIPFCPEVAGGLPTPRAPAEIQGGAGEGVLNGIAKVRNSNGTDVTEPFLDGAYLALQLCQEQKISLAILTERSPSCGSSHTYDGNFTGTMVDGAGVTSALLIKNRIRVFNQHQIEEAYQYYCSSSET